MSGLKASDIVLDIGSGAHQFNRANCVMDAESYETRGYYKHVCQEQSIFRRWEELWSTSRATPACSATFCEKTPYPFADKAIDLVICSHTLEDATLHGAAQNQELERFVKSVRPYPVPYCARISYGIAPLEKHAAP
jgi:hypothetical protein